MDAVQSSDAPITTGGNAAELTTESQKCKARIAELK